VDATKRVGRLTTKGRRSGLERSVTVGFVPAPDGDLLLVSRGPRGWTANLRAAPSCTFEDALYVAVELHGDDLVAARRAYGQRYPEFEGAMDGGLGFHLIAWGGPGRH
jgi:deazaflavin-dependent oxidoreductase (nitroreductase family)